MGHLQNHTGKCNKTCGQQAELGRGSLQGRSLSLEGGCPGKARASTHFRRPVSPPAQPPTYWLRSGYIAGLSSSALGAGLLLALASGPTRSEMLPCCSALYAACKISLVCFKCLVNRNSAVHNTATLRRSACSAQATCQCRTQHCIRLTL